MFSQEVKDKAVSEFLQSGLSYRVFCDSYYSYLNYKTLSRWVHDYKVMNNLAKEYTSIKKVSKQEPVAMVCYDIDKRAPIKATIPAPVVQKSYSIIANKIQFQSDVLNIYEDLSDVKYSEQNNIILKRIRGLCNEFTI
jgi:hypothetical protein